MTVDDLLDAAVDHDPEGYSREALRAMYNGLRRFQFRGMLALASAVGAPAAEFPELRLAYAQCLLDDRTQGLEDALLALDRLDPRGTLDPGTGDLKLPAIKGRTETLSEATRLARALERRLGSDRG